MKRTHQQMNTCQTASINDELEGPRPDGPSDLQTESVSGFDRSVANTRGTVERGDVKERRSYTDLSKQNRVWCESKFKTFKPEGKGRRGWERWRQLDWSPGDDCSHRGRRGRPLLVAEKDLFFSAFFGISLAMCSECQLSVHVIDTSFF